MKRPYEPEIIYEDNHLIAVNKRWGEIAQGDKTGDAPVIDLMKEYIKKRDNKPGNVFLGLCHRLDRPTSGILVMAKTSKALTRMNTLFQDKGAVKKIYWAVVDRRPAEIEGTLTHFLKKNQEKNKSFASKTQVSGSKKAVLKYKLIGSSDNFSLLQIEILTGRHHQIRAQLAAIGLHIRGDLKYGASRSNYGGGIHLHARKLTFIHPVKKEEITIIADPPKESLWHFFLENHGD